MKNARACIFDIDNVLVDTRYSYTDCIRETVQQYLVNILGYRPSRYSLLTQRDVELFKLLGGFNDDWDTCYGLLLYFASLGPKTKCISELRSRKNLRGLLRTSKVPLGVKGIEARFGKVKLVSLNKIEPIFQELYWSRFIKEEKPIFLKPFFRQLKARGFKIGIATGRNLEEARYVLKRYKILNFIDSMVTLDHLPHPKFKKPNPYSLIQIIKTFGPQLRYIYIGDLPDDVRMASLISKRFKIEGWGFNLLSSSKKETRSALLKAGATKVFGSSSALKRALFVL